MFHKELWTSLVYIYVSNRGPKHHTTKTTLSIFKAILYIQWILNIRKTWDLFKLFFLNNIQCYYQPWCLLKKIKQMLLIVSMNWSWFHVILTCVWGELCYNVPTWASAIASNMWLAATVCHRLTGVPTATVTWCHSAGVTNIATGIWNVNKASSDALQMLSTINYYNLVSNLTSSLQH